MTIPEIYFTTMFLIIITSFGIGFVLGTKLMSRRAVRIIDAKFTDDDGHYFWCSPECPDEDCEICSQLTAHGSPSPEVIQ